MAKKIVKASSLNDRANTIAGARETARRVLETHSGITAWAILPEVGSACWFVCFEGRKIEEGKLGECLDSLMSDVADGATFHGVIVGKPRSAAKLLRRLQGRGLQVTAYVQ